MATVKDIYRMIDKAAPFDSMMSFDNTGILVGDADKAVKKVIFALDITRNVVQEAEDAGADLIISHHPVIFQPLKNVSIYDPVYDLARSDIAALCCHTNLDIAPEIGVNISLADKLGLSAVRGETETKGGFIVYSGILPSEMKADKMAEYIKNALNCSAVNYYDSGSYTDKLYFCSGAGGDYIGEIADAGGKAFLTGELKHHERLEALKYDITVIEAGHYETERYFYIPLIKYLEKEFDSVEFIASEYEKNYFEVL